MKVKRLLLGSCGGLTGVYITSLLKDDSRFKLYGFDVAENIYTKEILDHFYVFPRLNDDQLFLEKLVSVCNEKNIDAYIPLLSREIKLVAKNSEYLKSRMKTNFLTCPYDAFFQLEDKSQCYLNLNKIGFSTPEIVDLEKGIYEYPLYLKPREGSGSKDNFIINDDCDLVYYTKKYKDSIILKHIKGTEYTVDAYFDTYSNLVTFNQRIRVKTMFGASIITENNFDVVVDDEIRLIGNKYRLRGPVNFQFFLLANGDRIYFDLNLRFASGGLPLSVESGANIPLLLIYDLLGIPYNKESFQSDRKKRIMQRYFKENYVLV